MFLRIEKIVTLLINWAKVESHCILQTLTLTLAQAVNIIERINGWCGGGYRFDLVWLDIVRIWCRIARVWRVRLWRVGRSVWIRLNLGIWIIWLIICWIWCRWSVRWLVIRSRNRKRERIQCRCWKRSSYSTLRLNCWVPLHPPTILLTRFNLQPIINSITQIHAISISHL